MRTDSPEWCKVFCALFTVPYHFEPTVWDNELSAVLSGFTDHTMILAVRWAKYERKWKLTKEARVDELATIWYAYHKHLRGGYDEPGPVGEACALCRATGGLVTHWVDAPECPDTLDDYAGPTESLPCRCPAGEDAARHPADWRDGKMRDLESRRERAIRQGQRRLALAAGLPDLRFLRPVAELAEDVFESVAAEGGGGGGVEMPF